MSIQQCTQSLDKNYFEDESKDFDSDERKDECLDGEVCHGDDLENTDSLDDDLENKVCPDDD